MHKLLERQLRRAFGAELPAGLEAFLESVDAAYAAADADRLMVERSLELMSSELSNRNAQLRNELAVQRQIQDRLARREEEFRDLIERVPQVIMVRRGAHLVFVNRAGLDALGRASVEEIAQVPVLELFHPDDRAQVAERMRHIDETRTFSGPAELRMLKKDGDVVTFELGLGRVIVFDDQPAVLLAAHDVTARKQLEARLQLSDRMSSVGTLAAGVAHEINNPLAYVMSNLDYLAERLGELPADAFDGEVDEVRQALGEAVHGARRVREIVKGLKIFSRADEDTRGLVDLEAVLESSISIAHNELRHRARLTRAYSGACQVIGNAGRLGQVFVNLLVNAAQAIPDGAADRNEVALAMTRVGAHVKITVRDTGCGMPPHVQKRIFDPFFTTKPIGVGNGLGLSICHGIVTSHGGEISVESQPGRGTTFIITLPAASAGESSVSNVAHVAAVRGRRRRVLVVDDEPFVGGAVRRALKEHEVHVTTNGREALAKLLMGEQFDAVFCDLMMPEMTGMELHAAIRARWPQVADRMIFLTGGAFSPSARTFFDEIPNKKLTKPFDANELRAVVLESRYGP